MVKYKDVKKVSIVVCTLVWLRMDTDMIINFSISHRHGEAPSSTQTNAFLKICSKFFESNPGKLIGRMLLYINVSFLFIYLMYLQH